MKTIGGKMQNSMNSERYYKEKEKGAIKKKHDLAFFFDARQRLRVGSLITEALIEYSELLLEEYNLAQDELLRREMNTKIL